MPEGLPEGVRVWLIREMQGRRLKVEGPVVPRDPETGHRETTVVAVSDLPAIIDQAKREERERLLDELCEWLGSDEEYDALGAIQGELEANPQLVPKTDVPLRLLKALRAAVDRFADSLDTEPQDEGER